MNERFDLMTRQLAGDDLPELPEAPNARQFVAQEEPAEEACLPPYAAASRSAPHSASAGRVHRCMVCPRLTLGWLCRAHREE